MREIVVDPNTGQWKTYGDNGAEFAHIPHNAIVFNHLQTEQLLNNGRTGSRAKDIRGNAYANGNAYVGGKAYVGNGSGHVNTWDYLLGTAGVNANTGSINSGSYNSYAEDAKDAFDETIDWIETAVERIERLIENVGKIADSTYYKFETRNDKLTEKIAMLTDEIDVQTAAYNRYVQEFNSVGLSYEYALKVQMGLIDIEHIVDEELKKQIDLYKEWYDKALQTADAIEDIRLTLLELYQTRFDNVSTEFDGLTGLIQNQIDLTDAYISLTEEEGYRISSAYYNALSQQEESKLNMLQSERDALQRTLDEAVANGIEESSEAWVEMKGSIDEVDKSIVESTKALVEYENTLRQMRWDIFNEGIEQISDLNSEMEFFIDLLDANEDLFDKDTGKITANGTATMGLIAGQYNNYMIQANGYAREIEKINAQLVNDPNNKKLIDKQKEYNSLQRDAIKNAEGQRDAIKGLVKEGIDVEVNALNKLISKYTDMLDREKDAYEYQQSIEEKSKNITSLQKQLNVFGDSSSEENRLRAQKLRKELEDAQKDLQETQYDKYITETKTFLSDLQDEYENILMERLDNIDALVLDVIDSVNVNSKDIDKTLNTQADRVGYVMSEGLQNLFDTTKAVSAYNAKFADTSANIFNVVQHMDEMLFRQIEHGDSLANIRGYASGSRYIGKSGMFWTNENSSEAIVRKSDGAILTRLNVGDMVLPTNATNNLWKMMNNPQAFFDRINDSASTILSGASNTNDVNVNMSITLPSVKNYEEFKTALKADKNVERFIQEITFGQTMLNHGKLRKYSI